MSMCGTLPTAGPGQPRRAALCPQPGQILTLPWMLVSKQKEEGGLNPSLNELCPVHVGSLVSKVPLAILWVQGINHLPSGAGLLHRTSSFEFQLSRGWGGIQRLSSSSDPLRIETSPDKKKDPHV